MVVTAGRPYVNGTNHDRDSSGIKIDVFKLTDSKIHKMGTNEVKEKPLI